MNIMRNMRTNSWTGTPDKAITILYSASRMTIATAEAVEAFARRRC